MSRILTTFCMLMMLASAHVFAQETESEVIGGDTFLAGESPALSKAADRDVFAAGFSIDIDAPVAGDAHYAGFSIDSEAPVSGDLYAAGFSIEIDKPVGSDVSAAGFKIQLAPEANVGGNARMAGRTITVNSDIAGSLSAAADVLTLNGEIAGDIDFAGRTLSFGEGAKIGGKLVYTAPKQLDIPATVIGAERVRFEQISLTGKSGTKKDDRRESKDSWLGALFSGLLGIVFLLAIGALFLATMPGRIQSWREAALKSPWIAILLGFIALGTLVGLVPVSIITIIGLPLAPFLLVMIFAGWMLGYLLGTYTLSWRLRAAFAAPPDTLTGRLVLLGTGLVLLALLNFIPVLGWLINVVVVFLGLGTLSGALFNKLTAHHDVPAASGEA